MVVVVLVLQARHFVARIDDFGQQELGFDLFLWKTLAFEKCTVGMKKETSEECICCRGASAKCPPKRLDGVRCAASVLWGSVGQRGAAWTEKIRTDVPT